MSLPSLVKCNVASLPAPARKSGIFTFTCPVDVCDCKEAIEPWIYNESLGAPTISSFVELDQTDDLDAIIGALSLDSNHALVGAPLTPRYTQAFDEAAKLTQPSTEDPLLGLLQADAGGKGPVRDAIREVLDALGEWIRLSGDDTGGSRRHSIVPIIYHRLRAVFNLMQDEKPKAMNRDIANHFLELVHGVSLALEQAAGDGEGSTGFPGLDTHWGEFKKEYDARMAEAIQKLSKLPKTEWGPVPTKWATYYATIINSALFDPGEKPSLSEDGGLPRSDRAMLAVVHAHNDLILTSMEKGGIFLQKDDRDDDKKRLDAAVALLLSKLVWCGNFQDSRGALQDLYNSCYKAQTNEAPEKLDRSHLERLRTMAERCKTKQWPLVIEVWGPFRQVYYEYNQGCNQRQSTAPSGSSAGSTASGTDPRHARRYNPMAPAVHKDGRARTFTEEFFRQALMRLGAFDSELIARIREQILLAQEKPEGERVLGEEQTAPILSLFRKQYKESLWLQRSTWEVETRDFNKLLQKFFVRMAMILAGSKGAFGYFTQKDMEVEDEKGEKVFKTRFHVDARMVQVLQRSGSKTVFTREILQHATKCVDLNCPVANCIRVKGIMRALVGAAFTVYEAERAARAYSSRDCEKAVRIMVDFARRTRPIIGWCQTLIRPLLEAEVVPQSSEKTTGKAIAPEGWDCSGDQCKRRDA